MRTLRRVLIVHPYGIGDLLFVTPVLRALRLIPTVETVDLLLGSRTREVVEHNPHTNDIFVLDKDRLRRQTRRENFRDLWELGKTLRAKHYDLLLDYSLRPENAFWSQFFLGIPKRAGFGYKRRALFHNIRFPIPEGYRNQHVVDFYAGLAELAGVPVRDRFLEYYFPPDTSSVEKEVSKKLTLLPGKFLTVAPGGGDSWGKEAAFKRWPVKHFAELVKKMKQEYGADGVAILGSGPERQLCEELQAMIGPPSVVFAGDADLVQTAMVLKKSALFIGNDGGLVHLAHALQVPLIAFYGPVPPEVYGPYPPTEDAVVIYKKDLDCRPCYYRFRFNNACPTIACLKDLTPDEALRMIVGRKTCPA